MMDHLARTSAAIDWPDETGNDTAGPIGSDAVEILDAPPLSESEAYASLRCPVGRIRTQRCEGAASHRHAVAIGPSEGPRRPAVGPARITAFPGGEAPQACRSIPMGRARDITPDANRTESAFAGRVRGITDTF